MWFEQRVYSVNICGDLQHPSYSIKHTNAHAHTDIQFKFSAVLKDFCTFVLSLLLLLLFFTNSQWELH